MKLHERHLHNFFASFAAVPPLDPFPVAATVVVSVTTNWVNLCHLIDNGRTKRHVIDSGEQWGEYEIKYNFDKT